MLYQTKIMWESPSWSKSLVAHFYGSIMDWFSQTFLILKFMILVVLLLQARVKHENFLNFHALFFLFLSFTLRLRRWNTTQKIFSWKIDKEWDRRNESRAREFERCCLDNTFLVFSVAFVFFLYVHDKNFNICSSLMIAFRLKLEWKIAGT